MTQTPHDDHQLEIMRRQALPRRFGAWMAFLPGILAPVVGFLMAWLFQSPSSASVAIFLLTLLVYSILSLVWIFRCAQKLETLARAENGNGMAANGCGMMILFTVGNSILGIALIYGTCTMMR